MQQERMVIMKLQRGMKRIAACMLSAAMTVSVLSGYGTAVPGSAADGNTVFINEVCAQNKSYPAPDGGYYDYIELYNSSMTAEVDLSGWGLTDKANTPYRFAFPEGTVLSPRGHLLVYCEGSAALSESMYLASFGLSANGETLLLTDASGQQIDTLTFGVLETDHSYGRKPDGSESCAEMSLTPGQMNAMAVVYVPEPEFSAESGFYNEGFDVSLYGAEGYEIYYTLDGSDPSASDTAILYDGSAIAVYDPSGQPNVHAAHAFDDGPTAMSLYEYDIPAKPVDKAMILRACAKGPNNMCSDIVTRSYFVGHTGEDTYYDDVTVVSLVTDPENLFDPETGIYVVGNQFYEWMESDDYKPITNVWDKNLPTNFFSDGREWERPGSVSIFEGGEHVLSQNVGIQLHGSSTRNSHQKSFNIYARSEYGDTKIRYDLFGGENLDENGDAIEKYDSFTLRHWADKNAYTDALSAELASGRENATLRNKPCVVFLDGEFWGFYYIQEKYSEYYLECHYGVPEEDIAYIKQYELKEGTGQDYGDFEVLCDFVRENDMSLAENYEYFCSQMDAESLMNFFCIGLYLGTWDWPNWNYGVWRSNGAYDPTNPYTDGKWRFMSYDFDYTQGYTYESYGSMTGYNYDYLNRVLNVQSSGYPGWLLVNLLENETFKEQFAVMYEDYCNMIMNQERAIPLLEKYHETNREMMVDTLNRFWGGSGVSSWHYSYYEENKKTPEMFFKRRADYALSQLRENLNLTGDSCRITVTNPLGYGTVTVNTAEPDLNDGSWTGTYYSDYPVTVSVKPAAGKVFLYWKITDASGTRNETNTKAAVTLSGTTTVEAVYRDMPLRGDLNRDGSISMLDAVLLQKYLLNISVLSEEQLYCADVQTSGSVNIFDLTVLKQIL